MNVFIMVKINRKGFKVKFWCRMIGKEYIVLVIFKVELYDIK